MTLRYRKYQPTYEPSPARRKAIAESVRARQEYKSQPKPEAFVAYLRSCGWKLVSNSPGAKFIRTRMYIPGATAEILRHLHEDVWAVLRVIPTDYSCEVTYRSIRWKHNTVDGGFKFEVRESTSDEVTKARLRLIKARVKNGVGKKK